jgi:hypothetical protein
MDVLVDVGMEPGQQDVAPREAVLAESVMKGGPVLRILHVDTGTTFDQGNRREEQLCEVFVV